VQQPRKREPGGWQAALSSDLAEPVDHVESVLVYSSSA
jgi:hypothetical protein